MSWNHTPPSTRKPKIQQQSWDGTPTINLYEPSREYESNPNMPIAGVSQAMRKSPGIQPRKVNYNKYCMPNPKHQMSDPGSYTNMSPVSSKSPKSPNQTFDFELTSPQHSRTPLKSVAANRRFYEDTSTDLTPVALMSPRKFEFGAVSPKYDKPGERNSLDTSFLHMPKARLRHESKFI